MLATLDMSHLEISQLNDDVCSNIPFILVTLDTPHLEISPINDDAEANMYSMLVTLDTSHLEMSPVNAFAPVTGFKFASRNKLLKSFTAETFQDLIRPCGPLEQSWDSSRHSTMAAWSSALDLGAHPVVGRDQPLGFSAKVTITIYLRGLGSDEGQY